MSGVVGTDTGCLYFSRQRIDAGNLEPLVVAREGLLVFEVEVVLEGLLSGDAAQVVLDHVRLLLLLCYAPLAEQTSPHTAS